MTPAVRPARVVFSVGYPGGALLVESDDRFDWAPERQERPLLDLGKCHEHDRRRSIVIYVSDINDPAVPAFAERLKASLSARYTRIYPPPDQPLEAVVYVIYRRDAVSSL